ncbi:hypothetical protein NPIL_39671 [Nephila pilipes]|uniref:Uncharacterized protein n=1 Tax=Nephila pilipes TaxID=299642 RepID=A0A8X6QS61_NEPPI|nr:hypothetical protein NPIL_39671 [Nephila pilipes]
MYVLHSKVNFGTISHIVSYSSAIAEELLEQATFSNFKCNVRSSNNDTPFRLQSKNWAHFLENIPSTILKLRQGATFAILEKLGKIIRGKVKRYYIYPLA